MLFVARFLASVNIRLIKGLQLKRCEQDPATEMKSPLSWCGIPHQSASRFLKMECCSSLPALPAAAVQLQDMTT